MELRRSIALLAGSGFLGALVFWIPAMLLRAATGLVASCVLAYTSAELRPEGEPAGANVGSGELRWTRLDFRPSRRCLVCATELELDQTVQTCAFCDASLHAECHDYLGGCARYGCPGSVTIGARRCAPAEFMS